MKFEDRAEAGLQLAEALRRFQDKDTVVLAVPRGGAVIGAEVARILSTPLSLVLSAKIRHPLYPEYAIGAIAEDDITVYDPSELNDLDETWRKQAEQKGHDLIATRRSIYFDDDYEPPDLEGNTVVIVDDGIATGLSLEAAVEFVRSSRPKQVIVAAPVASPESVSLLEDTADQVIILDDPDNFLGAVGAHYHHFPPVDDEEVRILVEDSTSDM